MNKRLLPLGIFLFVFLGALLAWLPASWLDAGLQSASQGRMALAYAGGTVWDGSATPVLRTQDNNFIALPHVRWKVDALPLFTGKIKLRLTADEAPAAEAVISWGRAEFSGVAFSLPVEVLGEVAPLLKPARLHGQIAVQSSRLAFFEGGIEGSATVDWLSVSSALSDVAPLGNYRLSVIGAGKRLNLALATRSGALLLEGQGNFLLGRGLEFHAHARAASGYEEALSQLLYQLGPELSPGVHGIDLVPR